MYIIDFVGFLVLQYTTELLLDTMLVFPGFTTNPAYSPGIQSDLVLCRSNSLTESNTSTATVMSDAIQPSLKPTRVDSTAYLATRSSMYARGVAYAERTTAGLDFANVKAVGVSDTAHGTRPLKSRSTPSSNHKSKHDVGVMAGIGVGAGVGVVLIFAALVTFFVRRHRKRDRARKTSSSVAEASDTLGAGDHGHSPPLTEISPTALPADLAHADPPRGLPGSDPRAQELDYAVAHKAGKEEV
ncbi:hypothetical protein AAEP93_009764 [Penicillium crustosum]